MSSVGPPPTAGALGNAMGIFGTEVGEGNHSLCRFLDFFFPVPPWAFEPQVTASLAMAMSVFVLALGGESPLSLGHASVLSV